MKSIYWKPYETPHNFKEYVAREWWYIALEQCKDTSMRLSCQKALRRKGFVGKLWHTNYKIHIRRWQKERTFKFKLSNFLTRLSFRIQAKANKLLN